MNKLRLSQVTWLPHSQLSAKEPAAFAEFSQFLVYYLNYRAYVHVILIASSHGNQEWAGRSRPEQRR
jgi:hypothetical protein